MGRAVTASEDRLAAMAKNKPKKNERRSDQVRSAVDQAFQQAAGGAQVTRDRAQEIADELAAAAGKVRDALDELRPPTGDEVKALQDRVNMLEARIAKLEKTPRRAPAKRASTSAKPKTPRAAAAKPATPETSPA